MKIISTIAIVLALVVGVIGNADAAINIIYSADTQVSINGNNYTISSGSKAASAIINPTNLVVVVPTGSTFTLVSPSGYLLTNVDNALGVVAQTCADGQRTLALTGDDALTVTITPDTSATCAGRRVIPTPTPTPTPSSGGGGGGGGSSATPTPTPSATPTPVPGATPTPAPTPTILPGPATPNYHSGVTLYRVEGDHRVYVVKDGKKSWIKSAEEFNSKGYKWTDIVVTTAAVLGSYPDDTTVPAVQSGVTLYRAEGDNRVYVVKDGKKTWVKSAEEFNSKGYKWTDIVVTSPATVASLPDDTGTPAASSTVTLYRADGDYKVYAVSGGVKQWIKTAAEFNSKGYKWTEIVVTTPETVASYPDGAVSAVTVKVVKTPTLRVRKSNTTASAILGNVKLNEVFTVLEESSSWYKITLSNGVTGWISGAYAVKQ